MRLDLGAGNVKTEGYLSVDISEKCNPDFVWDIRKTPYPKEWEGCDEVRADNIFEHLTPDERIKVINEINRILKPGGKLWYRVPLLKSKHKNILGAFTDPTHKCYFTLGTPNYWDKDHPRGRVYGRDYGIIPWKMLRCEEWNQNTIFLIVEMEKI